MKKVKIPFGQSFIRADEETLKKADKAVYLISKVLEENEISAFPAVIALKHLLTEIEINTGGTAVKVSDLEIEGSPQ